MVGQQEYSWWAWGSPAYIYQATVQINNHDTMAEVALGRSNFVDELPRALPSWMRVGTRADENQGSKPQASSS